MTDSLHGKRGPVRGAAPLRSTRQLTGLRVARSPVSLALAAMMAAASPSLVHAQSNVEGSVYGTVPAGEAGTVLVESIDSGKRVSVDADASGRFRVGSLPVGRYRVTLKRTGQPDVVREVSVAIGGSSRVEFEEAIEEIVVTGSGVAPVDLKQTESVLNISAEELTKLPVARSMASVAMLAPGVVKGDAAFGSKAISFGGASVAENAYYFNGFNITDFREGVGFADIPYEFFDTMQVKTGGYGAEFGRSLGGVVNTTSKRGTDQFNFGANVFWEPGALYAGGKAAKYVDEDGNTQYWSDFRSREVDTLNANLFASGAIVPGHLYAYGLVNLRRTKSEFPGNGNYYGGIGTFNDETSTDPFFGAKIDYLINDNHSLEFTYFHNKNEATRDRYYYDNFTERKTSKFGSSLIFETGGDAYIGRYTGRITDSFTISALAGRSTQLDDTTISNTSCIYGSDRETGKRYGCAATSQIDLNDDSRNAYRLDLEYAIASHVIRGGIDYEKLSVGNNDYYAGPQGEIYLYFPSVNAVGDGGYGVEVRRYQNIGNVETLTSALYLEDRWQVSDRLSVYAGIRNETFENKNIHGETFIKMDDQWAPRLGLAYDVLGSGRSSLYANWGRYYLPIATNTNIRAGGAELNEYWRYDTYGEIGPDGAPTELTGQLKHSYYNGSDGTVHDPRQLLDQKGLKPMYQDEYSIGFQMNIVKHWNADIRFIRRELKTSLEDECFDGFVGDASCALVNPGSDVTIFTHYQDTDGDGLYFEDPTEDMHPITLSNDVLGFPKARRIYNAVDFNIERVFDAKWTTKFSYTWSQSYGNTEGYANSDNGQPDPGITQSYDYPGLTDHSYGYLPNDRRHKIKLYGAYALTPEWMVGANVQVTSGRPKNCFGNYPDQTAEDRGDYSGYYGAASFYCNGVPAPRGSRGRLPWTYQLDLALRYTPGFVQGLSAGVDVFNVLNAQKVTQIDELGEVDDEYYHPTTQVNRHYGAADQYQTPRYFRFSLEYKFK